MNSKKVIFIFTRDRPGTLIKMLSSIRNASFPRYVIDDSTKPQNQQQVSDICSSFSNSIYLGRLQFNFFVEAKKINSRKFSFIIRELGHAEWNLGYARNFALLYSKSNHFEHVLFIDDDIQVPNLNLIDKLFHHINDYQFVGANILGLVDDSVLGHIATELDVINPRMISGGFMVFNPSQIDHFFLNNYNEDWIWLFLQLRKKRYLQVGDVFQELTDPLKDYKVKVLFQEFGEIALDGILDLYETGSYDSLIELSFWEKMIAEREEYLDLLISKAVARNKAASVEIIKWVKSNSTKFNAKTFCDLFRDYYKNRLTFIELLNSI